MSDEDTPPVGVVIVGMIMLAAVLCFLSFIWGRSIEREHWMRGSVADGHAEYYLDDNNNRQWRWK